MYISARAMGKPRALHDHEQLELLLESFVKQVEEIVSEVDTTVVSHAAVSNRSELLGSRPPGKHAIHAGDRRAHA